MAIVKLRVVISFLVVEREVVIGVLVTSGEDERRCGAVLDLAMVVVLVKRVDLVTGVLDEGKVGNVPPACAILVRIKSWQCE